MIRANAVSSEVTACVSGCMLTAQSLQALVDILDLLVANLADIRHKICNLSGDVRPIIFRNARGHLHRLCCHWSACRRYGRRGFR
jgi:hypothetical protein